MKFKVNENCIGCGLCEATCPNVFELTDEGYAKACAENALPEGFEGLDYFEFLEKRRALMSGIIKKAYEKLWE